MKGFGVGDDHTLCWWAIVITDGPRPDERWSRLKHGRGKHDALLAGDGGHDDHGQMENPPLEPSEGAGLSPLRRPSFQPTETRVCLLTPRRDGK